ncbi:phosphopentomutase [Flammeovirga yaeyamensis]|uniref:Phosphopentomutase n=1 Tax=Flammeovirga yaeyamensis TaxID=367791 RepID=A0AAX1N1E2_9BACT|nr:phosphopentomutase [Flammeovirga yaeyamensis]MBB3696303.1 phosphopentomutase [Flammeovirga yaeyamensis]NMF34982.1 phosphopentomutase [Flammeovirga yaeyamensis]QWG00191.1 phosphopentomutase [Flammeovirga yaeyamensis]
MSKRVVLVVLDSVGIGFSADADEYGDRGANTLGHIADSAGLDIPNMHRMGLGNIAPLHGLPSLGTTSAAYGMAKEVSKGKDTTTGHWEIAGQILSEPFPTYPNGFPEDIISAFEKATGRKTIGNKVASGTAIIEELGDQHVASGDLIVYTSADSVFQIAAHEEVVSFEELYKYCEIAREQLNVGRVIARPFVGKNGNYTRTSNRHDYSLEPSENMLTRIKAAGKDSIGVGKIFDIYAGKGFTDHVYTKSNEDGIDQTIEYLKKDNNGLIFTNLVDFDMLFGHRRDLIGYRDALEYFDQRLPEIMDAMKEDDVLIITADHGNDPIFKGTDHTREHIPILVYGKKVKPVNIGFRNTFADIGTTIEELLLNEAPTTGSFASMIL